MMSNEFVTIKNVLSNTIESALPEFQQAALAIHQRPEICNEEVFACNLLSELLKKHDFETATDIAGHSTGFTAEFDSCKPGPTIVMLAEYDALPGLGHGCGHNLSGVISALAAVGLKEILPEVGGKIRVYGTPGEEGGTNGSAKESFVRDGYFNDVDVAMMAHASCEHALTGRSLANDPVEIEFFGKAAHAAGAPWDGRNALDALLQVYFSINAMRQHVTPDVRIHGVITDGGQAPNIIPDHASARFYLRAAKRATVNELYRRVENIVRGAALATETTGSIRRYQNKVDDLIPTPSLDALYNDHLLQLTGETASPAVSGGSTDAGNVSQVIPTLHSYFKVMDAMVPAHSKEFCEACGAPKAMDSIGLGAKLLAYTALDLYSSPEKLAEVKKDYATQKANL